jgi:hypothetical protein
MRVIGPDGARLIVLYSAEEVRPMGGFDTAEFVRLASERYNFSIKPDLAGLKGNYTLLEFKTGSFSVHNKKISIIQLVVTNAGVVIDAISSEDADTFFDEIFRWTIDTFGLRRPSKEPTKRYLSNVVVEFEEGVEKLIPAFSLISDIATRRLQANTNLKLPSLFTRLVFSCDPSELPPNSIRSDLIIERRLDHSYGANRFFCSGPYPTPVLIETLQEIETGLRG